MKHSNLIGITGKAGAGKDTLAAGLKGRSGVIYSLASPLKRGIETMFGLPSTVWERDQKEVVIPWLGVSPRRLAQTLGTEWGRELIAPDVWLRVAERAITEALREGALVVVPDIRFDNEAEMIRRLDGIVVRVERDVAAVEAHVSEAGIADCLVDVVIENTAPTPWAFVNSAAAEIAKYLIERKD